MREKTLHGLHVVLGSHDVSLSTLAEQEYILIGCDGDDHADHWKLIQKVSCLRMWTASRSKELRISEEV